VSAGANEPGREAVTSDHGGAAHADLVQRAVEAFVEQHSCGQAPPLDAFVAGYPENARAEILSQCREFLSFDGLLGHQQWQPTAEEQQSDGRVFGDFLIQEELGRGGMGVVYLAQQRSLDRRVALKVMASGLTLSKRHVERFRREAAAAAKLRHPAIVPVHSLTEVDGTFALAMDYVAGRNLADMLDDLRLANGPSSSGAGEGVHTGTLGIAPEKGYVAECAMLAAQIASALAAAHEQQVVHRDLKPRNLMIDERRQVRLLDFGLAKSLDETRDRSLSMSGEITGTAHYMSPEQTLAKRVEVDHRADIWALGVILYELLTLQRPFDGKNLQQIVYEICFKEPVALQKRNPKVPRDLVTICNKALEKDPQNRYRTAGEFEADLQRFLRWEPIHARPVGAMTRAAKFLRRHRMETAIGATALLVTTVLLSAWWYRTSVDAQRADELMTAAQQHAERGDYAQAIASLNAALELRNDETTRTRLDLYHTRKSLNETDAAWKVARSKQLIEHDRERALLLALDAERQHSSAQTRSAVLDALGSGWSLRTLPSPQNKAVLAAHFSPNGRHLLTCGYPNSLQFFADDGEREPTALRGHEPTAPVVDAVFVGDDRIASVSPDRTLRVWNPERGGEPLVRGLDGQASAMFASRDGERALVLTYASLEGPFHAQVWDVREGRAIGAPQQHRSFVTAGAISPDGRFAATCSGTRTTVRLWRVDDGVTIAEIDEHYASGLGRVLAFSRRGELLAIGTTGGHVRVYDVATGEKVGTVSHPRPITSVAFDSKDTRMLTGSQDHTARLWEFERVDGALRLREAGVLLHDDGPVLQVAFDPTDELAITGTGMPDGELRIFDIPEGEASGSHAIHNYEVGAPIDRLECASDGHRVLALAGGRAVIWNFGTGRGVVTMHQKGKVPGACFVDDGRHVVTAGDDEHLRMWNTRDGRIVWTSERLGNPVLAVDVAHGGARIACSLVGGKVRVHGVRDGALQFELIGHTGTVPVVRYVGDGEDLLTAGAHDADGRRSGRAIVWDTTARAPRSQLDRPLPIVAADIDATGTRLVTVEEGEAVARLWRRDPDGEHWQADGVLGADEQLEDSLNDARFSPDGRTVLTAGEQGTARLFTLQGEQLRAFAAGSRLLAATFSPDGERVLTCGAGRNGAAQLWRTRDGEELLHFDGHRGSIAWGTFHRSGEWIATCSHDHTTCIWPTDPVAAARRLPLHGDSPAAAPNAAGDDTTSPR